MCSTARSTGGGGCHRKGSEELQAGEVAAVTDRYQYMLRVQHCQSTICLVFLAAELSYAHVELL